MNMSDTSTNSSEDHYKVYRDFERGFQRGHICGHRDVAKDQMLFVLTVLLTFFFNIGADAVTLIDSDTDIEEVRLCRGSSIDKVTAQVEVGMPFTIDCTNILNQFDYYENDWVFDNETTLKCIVMSDTDNQIVYEVNITDVGYDVYSLYDDYVSPYVIQYTSEEYNNSQYTSYLIGGKNCLKITITLTVIEYSGDQTCKEAIYDIDQVTTGEFEEGDTFTLECFAPMDNFHLRYGNFVVTWYKDCEKISSAESEAEYLSDIVILGRSEFRAADFNSTPGDYTCSIELNGRTRFISKTSICVKYRQYHQSTAIHTISSEDIKASRGEDVTLSCGGVIGSAASLSLIIQWIRNNTNGSLSEVCTFQGSSKLEGAREYKGNHYCSLYSNIASASKCFRSSVEAASDSTDGITVANTSLVIRDFKQADEGEYICRVITTRAQQDVKIIVTLHQKSANVLVIVLPTLAGILAVILIVMFVMIFLRNSKLKRKWRGTRKKQDCDYDETKKGIDNISAETEISTREKNLPQDVV